MSAPRTSPDLYWLPPPGEDWRDRLAALATRPDGGAHDALAEAVALARHDIGFTATNGLDRAARAHVRHRADVRMAILSSSTSAHLAGALRVAFLRRGLVLALHEPPYGQYRQALADPRSELRAFAPTHVLFAFDAGTVGAEARGATTRGEAKARADALVSAWRSLWGEAKALGASVLQQTVMARLPEGGGSNGHRIPGSGAAFVALVNERLREAADAEGVDLVALDAAVARDGLARWHGSSSWLGAKQEVALPAAPMYGDMVARLVAARLGRSGKCCVLDLDNTLWGGVVGDDGPRGVTVGIGSAQGEAFLAMQHYALALRDRGVLLAVCSKNDIANAKAPFEQNPDMALRLDDIACFVANWSDKPGNLREIARKLNIGVDSLVFVDDNPFERDLVRRTLPEVFVPHLSDDPADYPRCLADSGCFEVAALTDEDRQRAALYALNAKRDEAAAQSTDLASYLAGLDMRLLWGRVADADVARVTQLINKTNQFNLATRRVGEGDVRALVGRDDAAALRFRLVDRFGDNGIICVVTGRREGEAFIVDDWLMSCRVLGRRVEEAVLGIVATAAARMGAARLEAAYRPTERNGMVADLLGRLGFTTLAPDVEGRVAGRLDLAGFAPAETPMTTEETGG